MVAWPKLRFLPTVEKNEEGKTYDKSATEEYAYRPNHSFYLDPRLVSLLKGRTISLSPSTPALRVSLSQTAEENYSSQIVRRAHEPKFRTYDRTVK